MNPRTGSPRGKGKVKRRTSSKKGAAKRPRKPKPALEGHEPLPIAGTTVTMVRVDSLRPSRNARLHPPHQVTQIAKSIELFGWMNPPLVDAKSKIIAGHGRWQAAQEMGLEQMPVIRHTHLTARLKRAYILADNRLAELAGWDPQILATELSALGNIGFDLETIGWDPTQALEVIALAGAMLKGHTDPDTAPGMPENPVSQAGDIWSLADHRLLCGDATVEADVLSLIDGRRLPGLMVTDPPYGVEYDAEWRKTTGLNRMDGNTATAPVTNDDRADWSAALKLFPGDVMYVWHAGTKAHIFAAAIESSGFRIRSQIIWAKQHHPISRGAYHQRHEPLYYAVRENCAANWKGGRKQNTLWEIEHRKSDTGHSTQKPVEAMKRPIENHTTAGESVYDPFVGSGTTLIAAEMTGRICYAMEIEPGYVDVCVRRWQDFTGKTALLESSGQSWGEVEKERADAR